MPRQIVQHDDVAGAPRRCAHVFDVGEDAHAIDRTVEDGRGREARDGNAEGSMGIDAGDFDNDGDEDLFMTHLTRETNTLYVNDGTGLFEDRVSFRVSVRPASR